MAMSYENRFSSRFLNQKNLRSVVTRSNSLNSRLSAANRGNRFSLQNFDSKLESSVKTFALYKPIYLSKTVNRRSNELLYEIDDEFELIEKLPSNRMKVVHLRSSATFLVDTKDFQLDETSPLRLGTDERGVTQRCFLQYNVPGAFLIRRTKNEKNSFVLSVSQPSKKNQTDDWHYLIRVESSTRLFYFAHEKKLEKLRFKTFRQLVENEIVRENIPLKRCLPFNIDFEEDLWNIPFRHLTFQHRIGQGEFAEVSRASWKNGSRIIPVAVKKLHSINNSKIHQEIEALKNLRNHFIVTLYGVTRDLEDNRILIVTELLDNGDLKNWLKNLQELPDELTISAYGHDVSRGMAYLEQNFRIHRDLACRNLLVARQGKLIKIADFGLSTVIAQDRNRLANSEFRQKFPVRWTAPELLGNSKSFSIKSDVWSFGIVLIEIWLKGEDPYPDMKDLDSIQKLVQIGYSHRKPVQCSNQFYNRFILPCLSYEAQKRPDFKSLVEIFQSWNKEKADYDKLKQLRFDL